MAAGGPPSRAMGPDPARFRSATEDDVDRHASRTLSPWVCRLAWAGRSWFIGSAERRAPGAIILPSHSLCVSTGCSAMTPSCSRIAIGVSRLTSPCPLLLRIPRCAGACCPPRVRRCPEAGGRRGVDAWAVLSPDTRTEYRFFVAVGPARAAGPTAPQNDSVRGGRGSDIRRLRRFSQII